MKERTGIANLATTLVFGALLVFLALGSLSGPWFSEPPLTEKRELAAKPSWGSLPIREFPTAWENWFNDHFGYRATVVRAHNLVNLKLWGVSTVRMVLPGRHGWLFYDGRSHRGGNPRANYLGRLPDEHEKLFTDLQGQLEHTRDHFAAQGVDYLLVVVPDKWSIYPEYLPRSVGPAADRTSADLFLDHLRENSDLMVLDLKPIMAEAARKNLVYHRLDTHWNDTGAVIAARAIAERIRLDHPEVGTIDPAAMRAEWGPCPEGDLVDMLGLEGWLRESELRLNPADPKNVTITHLPRAPENPNPNRYGIVTRQDDSDLPRMLMLRDSFGDALIPFLPTAFAETHILWTSNNGSRDLRPYIQELEPDVVVELRAEKLMLYPERYYLAPGRRAISNHPGKK